MSCCEPVATGPTVSGYDIENVGGGVELFIDGSGPNPYQFRTLVNGTNTTVVENAETVQVNVALPTASTCENIGLGADVYVDASSGPFYFRGIIAANSTITITQGTTDVSIACNITAANEGGGAQVLDTSTSTAILKNLRSILSGDGSIGVTQLATTIDIRVASPLKTYFSEVTSSVGTNSNSYVVVGTMAVVSTGLAGETWVFVCSCLVCCLQGLTTVNQVIRWEIETSAGVWGILETAISHQWGITLAAGDVSTPSCRTYSAVLGMNSPRIRLSTRMSAFVASGGIVENPKVSGYKR